MRSGLAFHEIVVSRYILEVDCEKAAAKWGISAESLDHNKPPPSLILKIELFVFLAIFFRYPLIKASFLEVL